MIVPTRAPTLWIGGSACSGKSSVADLLGAKLGLKVYHCDDHWYGPSDHLARANLQDHPNLCLWRERTKRLEWFLTPPEEHAAIMDRAFREEFPMIWEDVIREDTGVVEGVSVTPGVMKDFVFEGHAVFLISTGSFRRSHYLGRGFAKDWVEAYAEPAAAFETLMAANDVMAQRWQTEAATLGFPVLSVDESTTAPMTCLRVLRYLGFSPNSGL